MSTILEQMKALADQAAATGPDMTEAQQGGGGARLLPVGYAFGRVCEYVEFGQQPQEYGGKAKDPALEFQLGFALTGYGQNPEDPANPLPYANDDGSPYVQRIFPMAMSRNEKARAYLLFKLLNWKGKFKHFGQLLGEAFLVKIVHEAKSKTDTSLVSRIDLKGFLPPLDPVTQAPYNIPPVRDEDLRVFFWDQPTLASWESLKIDGTNNDGSSKDFIRNQILSALDFSGSALEQLLLTNNVQFTKPVAKAAPAAPAAPSAAPAVPNVAPAAPNVAAGVVVATPAPAAPATASPALVVPASPSVPAVSPAVTQAAAPAVVAVVNPVMPAMPAMPALPVAA